KLVVLGELAYYLIIIRIILKSAASVDGTGYAQPIQFPHELARRVNLILNRQRWAFCQRRIEDHGVGSRDQHPGRLAVGIALNFASRWIGRVAGITHHT